MSQSESSDNFENFCKDIQDSIVDYAKKGKNKKYKTKKTIYNFICNKLGIIYENVIVIRNNETVPYLYTTYDGFTENIVWLSFPLDGLCIHCSVNFAMSLSGIKNIIQGEFKESAFAVDYYDPELKHVMRSPIIVITTLPLDSIILESNESNENSDSNENNYVKIKNLKSFVFNKC